MDEETKKLINEQAARLPSELRGAIEATPWQSLIKEVALANNVSLEKIGDIERETMLVIYGFDALENYIDNLSREAGINEEAAINIAEAANQKIFSEISRKAEELAATTKPATPVIITQETKKAVIAELAHRVEAAKQGGANIKPPLPKLAPEFHPMIKSGEVAHEVPHVETPVSSKVATPETAAVEPTLKNPEPAPQPAPASPNLTKKTAPSSTPRYPGGLDPYREPLK